jgi:hypothetical protein
MWFLTGVSKLLKLSEFPLLFCQLGMKICVMVLLLGSVSYLLVYRSCLVNVSPAGDPFI